MMPALEEGIRLFNSGNYFEAHEVLETVWLKTQGEEKIFLHGLIQIAVAFHHFTQGNHEGFRSVLRKAMAKLERFGESHAEIDLAGLWKQLEPWDPILHGTGAINREQLPPLPYLHPSQGS